MMTWPHDPDVAFLSELRSKELESWERRYPKRSEMQERGNVTWFDGFAGRAQGLAALAWGLDGDLRECRRWLTRSADMAREALALAPARDAAAWAERAALGLILNDEALLNAVGRFDANTMSSDDWDPDHALSLAIEAVDVVIGGSRDQMAGIAERWGAALTTSTLDPFVADLHGGLPALLQACATGSGISDAITRRSEALTRAQSNRIDRRRPIAFLDTDGLPFLTVPVPLPNSVADLSPYLPTRLLEPASD